MSKYDHKKIEAKWPKIWQSKKVFQAKDFAKKPKKYVLIEFPYPSGEGLHMGHLRPYTAGDVYSRFLRMQGKEVLYPIGWDAFGLPAENFAIKHGVNPAVSTARNIKNAKRQLQSWGMSFDWSREINTTDPNYYKWTQWLFLQFYKAGLAYEATGLINWCPKDKTGLANEEVIDGKCERCGTVVEKKELRQWYLKITSYAEKLLDGLKTLKDWPEQVKVQQENWIGKSVGAEIDFEIGIGKPNFLILHGYTGTSNGVFLPWLKKELENKGFKVQAPQLPNTKHPRESEQVDYVLQNCHIDENTILVGHSLGAIVAMKVLEKHGKKISGLVLVAAALSPQFSGKKEKEYWPYFSWDINYGSLQKLASTRTILSDLHETQRLEYLKYLSTELDADIISTQAVKEHFCGLQEPSILEALLPSIKVFTTRPDTLLGVTYMVLAPEHPLIEKLRHRITNWEQVQNYIAKAKSKTEVERTAEGKEKTGVRLEGVWVHHPAKPSVTLPVWVADYVLGSYGTGAIMAVPGHDERDFEFAKKFNQPIRCVIQPPTNEEFENVVSGKSTYSGEGILVNSFEFDGLTSQEARAKITAKFGKERVQYKLRDWVFSRQRYWGEPIPIIHCEQCGIVPVPEKDLPVKLPPVKKYEPTGTGESPLAAIKNWVNVKCPKCKAPAKRETNTMPQWAGSSWYWLRYTDPRDKKNFAAIKNQKYWTPVDVYFGGMEHTTLHLLYSRFWNLFLYDQKLVTSKEPYVKRQPHGIILAADGEKMSKSRGNVVNPDDVVKKFGADTLRMYELFLGPHEMTLSWNDQGILGVRRFLERVWNWINELSSPSSYKVIKSSEKAERALHKLIKKVTEDVENFRFNTAVSSFMEFYNQIKDEPVSAEFKRTFLKLLYPFAPHISEELNQALAGKTSLQFEKWPKFDPKKIVDTTVEIVVQINGKVRGKVTVSAGSDEAIVKAEALKIEQVKNLITADPKRVIYVPNKLINLVI